MTTLKTMWGTHPVTLSWVPAAQVPADYTVTSTHGFCFHEGKVILVDLDTRGWDIPGGHMEEGETPEECFLREAMEEACIEGDISMLGYVLVDNRDDPAFDASKYPEVGCQIFYRMDVTTLHPFVQEWEASERKAFAPSEVSSNHENWNIVFEEILKNSLNS